MNGAMEYAEFQRPTLRHNSISNNFCLLIPFSLLWHIKRQYFSISKMCFATNTVHHLSFAPWHERQSSHQHPWSMIIQLRARSKYTLLWLNDMCTGNWYEYVRCDPKAQKFMHPVFGMELIMYFVSFSMHAWMCTCRYLFEERQSKRQCIFNKTNFRFSLLKSSYSFFPLSALPLSHSFSFVIESKISDWIGFRTSYQI